MAVDTLDTFKEILSDIDSVQQSLGKCAVSGKIIAKIKNTMSDRHAAEKLFNELLHDYRKELLPTAIECWDQMADIEKENLTRVCHQILNLIYHARVRVWAAPDYLIGTNRCMYEQ